MSKRFMSSLAILAVVLLLVVTLAAAACGGDEEETTTTAAPTTTSEASETTEETIDAAALYAESCAGCHADGVSGSASEIETIIDDGADEMPAFGDKLSAEEVAAIAAYAADGGK